MGNLNRWRSSTLALLDQACPRALDHHEAGVPYARSVFGAGICAHACLEGAGRALVEVGTRPTDMDGFVEEVLDVVASQLMSEGRRFDGGPVEVMTPADVSAGRKLAADYLATHELSRKASYELGLAVDNDMRAVPYDSPDARLVGVLDVVYDEDQADEDGTGGMVRLGADYKTAWPAGASWLTGLQAKCQQVLLWASAVANSAGGRGGGIDGVQVCLVNLRTHGRCASDVQWLGDNASQEIIDGYWREIQTVTRAADHKPRHAQPGPKCMGCRYARGCEACFDAACFGTEAQRGQAKRGAAAGMVVTMYAASLARTEGLRPLAVEACAERGVVEVPGGEVGYRSTSKKNANADAPREVAREWLDGGEGTFDAFCGMLKALKLGSGNVGALAKHLWPARGPGRVEDFKERREAFLARALEEKPGVCVRRVACRWNRRET